MHHPANQPDRSAVADQCGAPVPGGRPNAEPGGGRASGAAQRRRLDLRTAQFGSAACCVADVATARRVSGRRCAGVAARAIRGSWLAARLALGRYGGQPWASARVQRRHALWVGRCRESAQRRWLSTSPREAALTRVSAYSAYAAWSRLAPLGQMTVTGMPRCRASVTTSAVPPYARAGSPSHTANKRSALSSMALLAAM